MSLWMQTKENMIMGCLQGPRGIPNRLSKLAFDMGNVVAGVKLTEAEAEKLTEEVSFYIHMRCVRGFPQIGEHEVGEVYRGPEGLKGPQCDPGPSASEVIIARMKGMAFRPAESELLIGEIQNRTLPLGGD